MVSAEPTCVSTAMLDLKRAMIDGAAMLPDITLHRHLTVLPCCSLSVTRTCFASRALPGHPLCTYTVATVKLHVVSGRSRRLFQERSAWLTLAPGTIELMVDMPRRQSLKGCCKTHGLSPGLGIACDDMLTSGMSSGDSGHHLQEVFPITPSREVLFLLQYALKTPSQRTLHACTTSCALRQLQHDERVSLCLKCARHHPTSCLLCMSSGQCFSTYATA